jgi:2-haloacid dehalogenase
MMNKILTFDCYGTLLNTEPLYDLIGKIAEVNALPREKAIELFSSYEDRLMYGAETFIPYDKLLYEILTYCNMELSTGVFTLNYNEIIEAHKAFRPFKDVMPALRKLKDNGYELAIMSNTTRAIMDSHLLQMENIFDDSLVAEETKCYKPNLLFFKMAETKFSLKEKEHCHIAKGYWWDIVPASKMRWNKVWVNRSNLEKGRESEMPYITVTSLAELPQF